MSTPTPTALKKIGNSEFQIKWSDGSACAYTAFQLRAHCHCATCQNEWTGEKLLQENQIPKDIHIVTSSVVGNYALGFTFSDGHSTGIYTFEHLRSLCQT